MRYTFNSHSLRVAKVNFKVVIVLVSLGKRKLHSHCLNKSNLKLNIHEYFVKYTHLLIDSLLNQCSAV